MNITINTERMRDYTLISLRDSKSSNEIGKAEKGFGIAASMFQQLIHDQHYMLEHVHINIGPVQNVVCYDFTISINLVKFIGKKTKVMVRLKDEQKIEFKTELSFGLANGKKKDFNLLPDKINMAISHNNRSLHYQSIAEGLLYIVALAVKCETNCLVHSVNQLKNSHLMKYLR